MEMTWVWIAADLRVMPGPASHREGEPWAHILGIMMIMKSGIALSSMSLSATLFTFSERDVTYSQDFTDALLSNFTSHTEVCQVHWVTGVLPASSYSGLTKYSHEKDCQHFQLMSEKTKIQGDKLTGWTHFSLYWSLTHLSDYFLAFLEDFASCLTVTHPTAAVLGGFSIEDVLSITLPSHFHDNIFFSDVILSANSAIHSLSYSQ